MYSKAVRFLFAIVASATTALIVLRGLYPESESLFPLQQGLTIGLVFFGLLRLAEFVAKRRMPAWIAVPIVAALTGMAYRRWLIVLMI